MANSLAGPSFRGKGFIPAWPCLNNGDPVPPHLASVHLDPAAKGASVGIGTVMAVTTFLQGTVKVGKQGDHFTVSYPSSARTSRGQLKTVASSPQGALRVWTFDVEAGKTPTGITAPSYLLLAELLYLDCHSEASERYQRLMRKLGSEIGHPAPYSVSELSRAAGNANEDMMSLSDAIYHAIMLGEKDGRIVAQRGLTPALPETDPFAAAQLPSSALPKSTPKAVLRRSIKSPSPDRNNTFLLFGPTATFKSTFAKEAAAETAAGLVMVQGRRSISDEDFLGARTLLAGNTGWFNGPVAEAFLLGRHKKVVLLVDEAARLDPFCLNAFIPFMDRHSAADVTRMADGAEKITELRPADLDPVGTGPHHVLTLPVEEVTQSGRSCAKKVSVPVENLTFVFTANLGCDYDQPADQFDGAFLSRIRVQIEVARPERDFTEPLYLNRLNDPALVDKLYALELFVDTNLQPDGKFRRPLNVTTNLAFLEEFAAATDDGLLPQAAFVEAADLTLVEKVCEGMEDGSKDAAAAGIFRDEVNRLAHSLAA
ncbi:hypothetical protein BH24DEI2_BH24DEI2_26100 [soil metagenome]